MRRAQIVWLLLLLTVLGCGEKDLHVKFTPRPKDFRSIVSLSPSTTELLVSQGVTRVKGRTAADNYPASASSIPVVASVKPDYEKIQLLAPDFVIYDGDLYSESDLAKLKAMGAELYSVNPKTVAEYEKQVYDISRLLGGETTFSSYVDRVEAARASSEANPPSPIPAVAIVMPSESGRHYVAGTTSFLGDVTRIAGGKLVGPAAEKFEPINVEEIVTANPDIIVVPATKADAGKMADILLKDARLRTVKAIANRRIIALDQDILLRRGGRVDKLIDNFHRALSLK